MRPIVIRRPKSIALALMLIMTASGIALAANPHFVGHITATLVDTNLLVSWREVGLGRTPDVTYVAVADAFATYVCVNELGQCDDLTRHIVSGPVSATGDFLVPRGGQFTQGLTLSLPATNLSCDGKDATVLDASYFNVTLTDVSNAISAAAVPSATSATFFVCP